MGKKKPKSSSHEVSWPEACRDVLIASMDKGQLPLMFVTLLVLLLVWKTPETVVGELAKTIVQNLKDFYLLGYVLFIITFSGAWYLLRTLRQMHMDECHRVGMEKTELQQKQIEENEKREK